MTGVPSKVEKRRSQSKSISRNSRSADKEPRDPSTSRHRRRRSASRNGKSGIRRPRSKSRSSAHTTRHSESDEREEDNRRTASLKNKSTGRERVGRDHSVSFHSSSSSSEEDGIKSDGRRSLASAPVRVRRTLSGAGVTKKNGNHRVRRSDSRQLASSFLSGGVSFHDAFLGTDKWKGALEKLNDSDGSLTKEKLMKMFDDIDSDGDGSGDIDMSELIYCLNVKAELNMTNYEINTLFRAADENGDGVISREEWEVLAHKLFYCNEKKDHKQTKNTCPATAAA